MKAERVPMTIHELDELGEPRNGPVQRELEKITNILTIPQVFIEGKFFGEAATIDKLKSNNELRKMLAQAGAF